MKVLWLTAITIIFDQLTKTIAFNKLAQSSSIPVVGDWLKLTYTENSGMAFGLQFGPPGTMAVFSSIATLFIIIYLFKVRNGYTPYRVSLALVLGGALGNIIDRIFYGVLYYGGPLFQGRVIDFIHFDFYTGPIPDAVPLLGGRYAGIFPIFNFADTAIVLGVVGILIFQKKYHEQLFGKENELAADVSTADNGGPATPGATQQAGSPPSESSPNTLNVEAPGDGVDG